MLRSATLAAQKGMGADEAYVRTMLGFVWGPLLEAIPKVRAGRCAGRWRVYEVFWLVAVWLQGGSVPTERRACLSSAWSCASPVLMCPPLPRTTGARHGDPGQPAGGGCVGEQPCMLVDGPCLWKDAAWLCGRRPVPRSRWAPLLPPAHSPTTCRTLFNCTAFLCRLQWTRSSRSSTAPRCWRWSRCVGCSFDAPSCLLRVLAPPAPASR